MIGQCCVCEKDGVRVYNTFGKVKCKSCIELSKTGKKGHSGMIYNKNTQPSTYYDMNMNGLCLQRVKKSHPLFVKWYIEHYPKSKGIVGRQLNYIIYFDTKPIGIIGVASPPLNYKLFREYFKSTNEKDFMNNNVYRIVMKQNDRNMGTKILKLLRNTVKKEYVSKYGNDLVGLVTFVEPPRTGAIYKADNWVYLGKTQGVEVKRRGDDWMEKKYTKGVKKHIFVKRI